MSTELGRADPDRNQKKYIGKADITRPKDFLHSLKKMGFPAVIEDSRLYFSGPRCETEQRFFILGCLRMWKVAETAGHIAKMK